MSQRTLSLQVRAFTPEDYHRLVELYNGNYPDYTTSVEERRSRDDSIDKSKYVFSRHSFTDRRVGAIVAFGEIFHITDMFHPYKFAINIIVEPKRQGQGIGRFVYDQLTKELESLHAITVWTQVKEDLTDQLGFYLRRGFREVMRVWESRLPVGQTIPANLEEYSKRVRSLGITITTLAEERAKDPESTKNLHRLVQDISGDIPQPAPYTEVPYEQWESFELKSPNLLPEAYFIAKDGHKYVGLSVAWKIDTEPKSLAQGNTGVIRDYRSRGVATALKLRVIDYARAHGYQKIKTWNASNNVGMLTVNTKLGFQRQVGWIALEKNLA